MNKIFSGFLLLLIAVFAVSGFTGCDTIGVPPVTSDGTQLQTQRAMQTQSPAFTPWAAKSDDSMVSGIENIGRGIVDFVEGKAVDLAAAPDVVSAVTSRYENVTVTGITHALHMGEQVYKVTYTDDNSSTHTVYVSSDLKTVTEATEPENSPSPDTTASSDASPSPTAPEEG